MAESPLRDTATEIVTAKLSSGTYFVHIGNEAGKLEPKQLMKYWYFRKKAVPGTAFFESFAKLEKFPNLRSLSIFQVYP